MSNLLELERVSRTYGDRRRPVHALHGLDVVVQARSLTAVVGPSGCGKSTFLQCAAGLDRPTAGTVRLAGRDLGHMGERERTRLRREHVGFVFQAFNLLPALTAQENVLLPVRLGGGRCSPEDVARARDLLARVGLDGRGDARPGELSGGQQQRVALARALVTAPDIVFADEPTGSLDQETAAGVLDLLRGVVDRDGATVVVVTHDPAVAARADRVLRLAHGRLVGDTVAVPA
ncbi:ABC transporter ATP-binding protein [Cellulomonas sp. ACRRI]|uniref:ABC transporter ATP-binding protein n=1 Tax=Cellulomonas sp. ACRRI TaxID=2918188 RepID=UPI001EF1E0F7|nr:ABC transporter ATP-binding protein [Cellulomonas sp. ACRRI]MCG7285112.1 ABC transporter ATP-binding protein [Cellulomonas sp. ACRRI]